MLLIGTSLYLCTPLQIARPHAASTMQNRLYDALPGTFLLLYYKYRTHAAEINRISAIYAPPPRPIGYKRCLLFLDFFFLLLFTCTFVFRH